jgi:hypothetical protein
MILMTKMKEREREREREQSSSSLVDEPDTPTTLVNEEDFFPTTNLGIYTKEGYDNLLSTAEEYRQLAHETAVVNQTLITENQQLKTENKQLLARPPENNLVLKSTAGLGILGTLTGASYYF